MYGCLITKRMNTNSPDQQTLQNRAEGKTEASSIWGAHGKKRWRHVLPKSHRTLPTPCHEASTAGPVVHPLLCHWPPDGEGPGNEFRPKLYRRLTGVLRSISFRDRVPSN